MEWIYNDEEQVRKTALNYEPINSKKQEDQHLHV